MKIEEVLTFGQQVYKFKLSDELCDALNERMDKEIEDKTFIDASKQLSAKIKKEYRIHSWLPEIDKENIFIQCIQEVMQKVTQYNNFVAHSVVVDNGWINDQFEGEYQVVHKHSGKSLIGFASIGYLKVPDFGEEYNKPEQPHNGRTMLLGNCQGQFSKKNIMLEPKVGDFYIFPYDLEHLVYPFRGNGMRRSLSLNYDVFHRHIPKK